jgi:hypothetical protein
VKAVPVNFFDDLSLRNDTRPFAQPLCAADWFEPCTCRIAVPNGFGPQCLPQETEVTQEHFLRDGRFIYNMNATCMQLNNAMRRRIWRRLYEGTQQPRREQSLVHGPC